VDIRVEPDGADSSIVSVTQSHFDFQEAIAERSSLGVIQTFWLLSLGNLVDHLAGRGVAQRCDFTSSEMRAVMDLDAPRQRVYEALSESDQFSAWSGIPITIEPVVGGGVTMVGLDVPIAKVVDVVDGRKMAVDWGDGGVGTWELEDSGGKDAVDVRAERILDAAATIRRLDGHPRRPPVAAAVPRTGELAADLPGRCRGRLRRN
jgi:uncharacterized protein YndB with AHSA1/START domain